MEKDIKALGDLANSMRIQIVDMISDAGSGHPGGSLSCIDILTALYFGDVMRYNPKDPTDPSRDRFILAKGHAAPALYAILANVGYLPAEELSTLRKWGSKLQGHPDSNLLDGIEVSTGSLGQGLSIASGYACGLRLEQSPSNVFALLGDGECEEGQVWEAAMFAAHQGLDNLIAIIDLNGLQIDGNVQDVCNPMDIAEKFASFGWDAHECDGHDIGQLVDALSKLASLRNGRPKALVARTVKGKGVSFMEGQASWHGKAPSADERACAIEELSSN